MLISNIQQFSVRDGPGIRTTVFTKGCSLRCKWCHNPETIRKNVEIQHKAAACVGCGACAEVCDRFESGGGIKKDAALCTACGECMKVCPTKALSFSGSYMAPEEVARLAARDKLIFKNSGGGVTISGGEPLLQNDLPEVLMLLRKKGIHTAVDTALNVPWESVEGVLLHTSLFLVDIKAMDALVHEKWTGYKNTRILENLERLLKTDAEIWVRIPYIPDANKDEMLKIARYLKSTCRDRVSVEVIPFHNYASGKYKSLGMDYEFQDKMPPEDAEYQRILKMFSGLKLISYK